MTRYKIFIAATILFFFYAIIIAVKALRIYANLRYDGTVTGYETIAKEALKEIKG